MRRASWSGHDDHEICLERTQMERSIDALRRCIESDTVGPNEGTRAQPAANEGIAAAFPRILRAHRPLVLAVGAARPREVPCRVAGHLRARGAYPSPRPRGRQPLLLTTDGN